MPIAPRSALPPGKAGALPSSVYDAIARSEGTYKNGGIDYNMLQGGGHADLTNMSLADVMALQHGETPAAGGFQIQRSTLAEAAAALKLDPNATKFSPEVQRQLAAQIQQKQGFGAWSGLKNHPEEMAKATAGMRDIGATDRFSAGAVNLARLNPSLLDSVKGAVARLPEGIRAIATSGARIGGLGGSRHHGGNAIDLQLIGADGKPIPNRGADTTGNYGLLARLYHEELGKRHPELAGRAAWGGNFETSPGSRVADLMHYDIGGDRGKFGSLGEQYRRLGTEGGYAPAVTPAGAGGAAEAGSADTNHRLEVHFTDAPPGMRSGLTRADGPAEVAVRTQYSMGNI
jgi:hypothetical protein